MHVASQIHRYQRWIDTSCMPIPYLLGPRELRTCCHNGRKTKGTKMLVVCGRRDWRPLHSRSIVHHEKRDTLIDHRRKQRNAYRISNSLDRSLSLLNSLPLIASKDCLGLSFLCLALDSSRFILENAVDGEFVARALVAFVSALRTSFGSLITLETVSRSNTICCQDDVRV